MAARKRSSNTARRPLPRNERDASWGVVIEQIHSQMQVVVEAVTSLSSQFDTKLDALEAKLSARIDVLEQVVRQNSVDIRALQGEVARNAEAIEKNSEDIKHLMLDVAALRYAFASRNDQTDLKALEARVERIEAKLGIAS